MRRWRVLLPAAAVLLVVLALAGRLWLDRGVGSGLRGHARDILSRYDGTATTTPDTRFRPGVQVESATTTADGTRLTVRFTGEAPGDGPCERDYDIEAVASARAVVVVVEGRPRGLLERFHVSVDVESCDAVGHPRTATVELAEPLGDRVVLDGRGGEPVPLTAGG